MKKLIEKILIKFGILANEQENKICNDIDLQLKIESNKQLFDKASEEHKKLMGNFMNNDNLINTEVK